MELQSKGGKQITLHEIIEDEKRKRDCDCWLKVNRCYCEVIKNTKKENEDTK